MSVKISGYEIDKPIEELLSEIKKARPFILDEMIDKVTDIKLTCPKHSGGHEKNPSCFVRKSDGLFHCFTCGIKGSFQYFTALCLGCSVEEAEKWLLSLCGVDEIHEDNGFDSYISLDKSEKEEMFLDESVLDDFQSYHPYMSQRGLTDMTIKTFEVKYDPKTKCIVFPVRDAKGRLKFLTRRSVADKRFIIDPLANKKDIYLLDKAKAFKTVGVVESQFNALTSWQYGLPCVALLGAGTTKAQVDALRSSDILHFVLMYDNDVAGRKGAAKFKKLIGDSKIVTDIVMPKGKDVNDLTKEEFDRIVGNLIW